MKKVIIFVFALVISIAFVATGFAQDKKEPPAKPVPKVEQQATPDKPVDKPVKEKKAEKKKTKKTKKAKTKKGEEKPPEPPKPEAPPKK
ncbi:MAG: hypothetical protein A4E64_03192 [Syntrophorhabdus sp. PtaU1.Bin058]|nr:MAG: hypothetical protein A4E64_03192 [Syntrophorhabdus sp. PtaU1.Bin058]